MNTPAQAIDLIISARWIIPVTPVNQVFEHCAIAIHNGRILAIAPESEITKCYNSNNTVELGNHLVIPGLINAHCHSAMSLFRGYADDKPLQDWLENHIWPAESRWVNDSFVREGTDLALAEMIKTGTTCFSDMYFFPEQAAIAAQEAGIRAQITFPIFDFSSAWGTGPDDYLHKGLALHDNYRSNELVNIAFGPHAPYTVGDETLAKIAVLSQEMDTPVQIHLHETAVEVEDSIKQYGKRPIERLHQLGLLSPLTQCVHMTQVNDTDIEILKQTGAHIIHCPESNLKLANGFCPIDKLMTEGINVAIGTDGAASNNDLNLLGETKTATLLAKAFSGNAAALDAHTAIRMATLNGAKALGLDNDLGSIEVGKLADITAIDLSALEYQPLYNPASQLIYTDSGHNVSHVWVNGRCLLKNKELQTLNEYELIAKAQQWQVKLSSQ